MIPLSLDDSSTPIGATVVLASSSPRRRLLLVQIGIDAVCRAVDIDESPLSNEQPRAMVLRLAENKVSEYQSRLFMHGDKEVNKLSDVVILGADTTIELDGKILGKPIDQNNAINMLLTLSDREHQVHTGVVVMSGDAERVERRTITTRVRMGKISESDAIQYWHTGEPSDKAGSYGIQGIGARFVAHISGSYSNVVGLPLYETLSMLSIVANRHN